MKLSDRLAERRKREACEAIAGVALELFRRNGFDSTSVESIADAAGCSPRTVYRYFGAKEDVLFYDLPDLHLRLGEMIDDNLAGGSPPWAATCEALIELISRFDAGSQDFAVARMQLWNDEPALRNRYMQLTLHTEQVVAERLHRHRSATPREDDLPEIIAVTAVGIYRATVQTHIPSSERNMARHLRTAFDLVGAELAKDARRTGGHAPPKKRRSPVRGTDRVDKQQQSVSGKK